MKDDNFKDGMKYDIFFNIASAKYGIPNGVLSRQCFKESSYNETAYNSNTGASGLMQIIKKWHPECKDPFDPQQAIEYGAKYLSSNYIRFGCWKKALAAYNLGPNRLVGILKEYGDDWLNHVPKETRDYVCFIIDD